jgi:hypothetical protein
MDPLKQKRRQTQAGPPTIAKEGSHRPHCLMGGVAFFFFLTKIEKMRVVRESAREQR